MRKQVVAVVIGTRPEAIKLGPVIAGLTGSGWAEAFVVTTGQHGRVVDDMLALYGTAPACRLPLDRRGEDLAQLASALVARLGDTFVRAAPDLVVVQGDTTSALAGALVGHLLQVPVAHVEAGLRSYEPLPFPEEINRRLIGPLADLHLAPTPAARDNLRSERVAGARIVVTGNTVIDALAHVAGLAGGTPGERPLVLVTAHRRESWGEPMHRIARVVRHLGALYPTVDFFVATHMNPAVRSVFETEISGLDNVVCAGPLGYREFVEKLIHCELVITDSGGVQEEAASLALPALVMREQTERMEGLMAGLAHLVGTDEELIVKTAAGFLDHAGPPRRRTARACAYGDGKAAERTVRACGWLLGLDERPSDFSFSHPLG
ncbi:non-hydrolyzing UDP-N-acetylglucosamine 2-epimerase [Sinosporangium siamense]|uniref:UDP-N-acetylglucosamine 2-epimerase (non-hydrolyzing) n=1 Tax=Sinosporangium siamense TaxID=1367973 RepID=A0A919RQB0_9ACTN|nr:UDP-N-acetylglucosamine 2-epimerase (non-hydrolyzing) [Sinosporangium siamense]GII96264.1 UDP-N-acetyl glucosamine 2-epimerase [Sinosporangium siamense]